MTISNATPYEPINQYLKHISLGIQTLCMCILTDYKNTINGTGIYSEMHCEDRISERLLLLHQMTTDRRRCTEIQNSHMSVTVNFTEWHHITYLQDFKISLVIVKPRGTFLIIFCSSLAKSTSGILNT